MMMWCPPGWQACCRSLKGVGLLLAIQVMLVPPLAAAPPAAPAAGINSKFLDPELDPQEWVGRFEVESREVFHAREAILAAVRLTPGARIADVGCGSGDFLTMFSRAVGQEGRVYAVDISPRLIEFVEKRVRDEQLDNIAGKLFARLIKQELEGSVAQQGRGMVGRVDDGGHCEGTKLSEGSLGSASNGRV